MADVSLHGITKSYGSTEILKGIDLQVDDKDFVVFVGPSGCGKSTLLRTIAGLETISGGELRIGGRRVNELPPAERKIAMVFQSYALYPHMSVYKNMAFGLKFAKIGKEEADRRVRRAADILKLTPLLDRKPRDLSGGQRQRVAIGRAIVREPSVFLFDEPLSNLDAALRVNTRLEIAKLHRELGATMIYVTHDQVEAMTLATKIVVLNNGHIEQVGSPLDLYHRPRNLFVAGFIGSPSMNFIGGTIEAIDAKGITVAFAGTKVAVPVEPAALEIGAKITVGIRPEHMAEEEGPNRIAMTGQVYAVEHLGDASLIYLKLADDSTITVRSSGTATVAPGDHYTAYFSQSALHIFDATGHAIARTV